MWCVLEFKRAGQVLALKYPSAYKDFLVELRRTKSSRLLLSDTRVLSESNATWGMDVQSGELDDDDYIRRSVPERAHLYNSALLQVGPSSVNHK